MAEFLNQTKPTTETSGFDAFGKEVPLYRRTAGLEHARQMGVSNTADATALVSGMAEQIERDQPYEAMAVGMKYLDLTGTYRLMAVLCTAELR